MTDERPVAQEAIWQQLRTVEPPADAKARVRAGIEQRVARRSRWIWLAVPAMAAAVVAVILVTRGGEAPQGVRIVDATSATQGDRALVAGELVDHQAVTVRGSLRVALERGTVDVVGPATVALSRERVDLLEGKLEIDGNADVRGPTCSARVNGKSTVELRKTQLVVTVFAGSAEILPPQIDCQVFDLKVASTGPEPTTPKPAVVSEPPPAIEPPPVRPTQKIAPAPVAPAQPSDLAAQTDAYWAAHALRERDPAGALAKLRDLVKQWPRAAIRHEVDLAIIDALVRLGRTDEARSSAKRFLRDHPTSARGREMQAIAGAP